MKKAWLMRNAHACKKCQGTLKKEEKWKHCNVENVLEISYLPPPVPPLKGGEMRTALLLITDFLK